VAPPPESDADADADAEADVAAADEDDPPPDELPQAARVIASAATVETAATDFLRFIGMTFR